MFRRLALSVLLVLPGIACSGPPTKEREQADSAMAAARAGDAATYAPAQLRAAEDALKRYDDAVAQRDYRQALNHAIDARDRANEATRRAGIEKAAARKQAEQLLAELDDLIKTASARLVGVNGPRLSSQSSARLRKSVGVAATAMQEARSAIESQNYRAAIDRLTPRIEALRKELAQPPASPRRGRGSGTLHFLHYLTTQPSPSTAATIIT